MYMKMGFSLLCSFGLFQCHTEMQTEVIQCGFTFYKGYWGQAALGLGVEVVLKLNVFNLSILFV